MRITEELYSFETPERWTGLVGVRKKGHRTDFVLRCEEDPSRSGLLASIKCLKRRIAKPDEYTELLGRLTGPDGECRFLYAAYGREGAVSEENEDLYWRLRDQLCLAFDSLKPGEGYSITFGTDDQTNSKKNDPGRSGSAGVTVVSNIEFIKQKLGELLCIVNELENRFPGRKFTLDGHLFGSLGEAIAKEFYNIKLARTGEKTHDGTQGCKKVQIKITQGNSVDINGIPDYLLVLFWDKQKGEIFEVYNGPCSWLKNCKTTKYGWYTRTLTALYKENTNVSDDERLAANTDIEKWHPTIRIR